MVLKFISRFFGKFLLSTALTVFILSFFIISLIDNLGVLKTSIKEELTQDFIIDQIVESENEKATIKNVIELCKENPQMKGCDEIIINIIHRLNTLFIGFCIQEVNILINISINFCENSC